jgi:hypothetical protein
MQEAEREVPVEVWTGCYDDSWDGFIVPEAFAHPAKYARGLITRIFQHMLDEGMLRKGDTCVDPFGGIACGGIVAAGLGIAWRGCELEKKFADLGQQNIDLHRKLWEQFGDPVPVLVNGDSRKLRENLGPVLAQAVVSSPPYCAAQSTDDNSKAQCDKGYFSGSTNGKLTGSYGKVVMDSPGQLGAMKPGDVDSVVSSPPYNLPMSQDHNGTRGGARGTKPSEEGAFVKYGNTPGQLEGLPMGDVDAVSSPPFVQSPGGAKGINVNGYGDGTDKVGDRTYQGVGGNRTPGNLEVLKEGQIDAVISSPPYAESLKGDNSERETAEDSRAKRVTEGGSLGQSCRHSGYGGPGNLGNMPSGEVEAVVTSPPFQGSVNREGEWGKSLDPRKNSHPQNRSAKYLESNRETEGYGDTEGQVGRMESETFWAAAKAIVSECHAILKPGGWSAWVVKDFIRNKQRVPFCDDWCKLLEACGFVVVKRVRASLVSHDKHPGLFGEEVVKTTKRASFFRRLYEKKYPENAIEWEEVVFAQKRSVATAEPPSPTIQDSSGASPAQPGPDTSPSTGDRQT